MATTRRRPASSTSTIPPPPPLLIAPRRPGFRYEAMDHGDVFYIRANSGGARDFQIVVAPRAAPEEGNWRPFVPCREGRLIEHATLFKDFLVLLAREDNVPRLIVHEFASGERARDRLRGADLFPAARDGLRVRLADVPLQLLLDGLAARRSTITTSRAASASCSRSR